MARATYEYRKLDLSESDKARFLALLPPEQVPAMVEAANGEFFIFRASAELALALMHLEKRVALLENGAAGPPLPEGALDQ